MLKKAAGIIKSEKGVATPEAMMIAGLVAVMALLAWKALKPFMVNAANTVGGKTFNAVNAGNTADW